LNLTNNSEGIKKYNIMKWFIMLFLEILTKF
jgi:hypothetical protein